MANTETWIESARRHEDALLRLVRAYHPASPGEKRELDISAQRAELASAPLRTEIAARDQGLAEPAARLAAALRDSDARAAIKILADAWIGVPESRDCWRVPGFREAVELLEQAEEGGLP